MRHTKIQINQPSKDNDEINIIEKYIIVVGQVKLELTREQAEELLKQLGCYI